MYDFSIIEDTVMWTEEVDLIMQQIEILLDTRNGEVLGEFGFGTRLDVYLYNPNIGNQTIANTIKSYITNNVDLFNWDLDVNVEFLAGTHNDILLLKITISDNKETAYTRTYKVSQGSVEY